MYFKEITKTLSLKQTAIGAKDCFFPIPEPTVPIAMYTWKWVLQNNVLKSDLVRAQSKSKRMLLPGATLKPWLLLCICLSLTISSTALLVVAKSHSISPTQQKEHPLDSTISCFSRSVTSFGQPDSTGQSTTPKSRLLSLPKTGKPPGPCCFLDPNRLIPHSHSSRPSVTYLDLAKKNEWFLGIPLEFLRSKLQIYQAFLSWISASFLRFLLPLRKKWPFFHIMKFPHLQAPSHEDSAN